MDILAKLFGSSSRVKILRLFLLNPGDIFENGDIVKKSKVATVVARREIKTLSSIGFINKKSFFKELSSKTSTGSFRKKRVSGWQLSSSFPLLGPLHELLINTEPLGRSDITDRLKKCGGVKLVVISGVFIQNPDSRVDMLIVGDKLKKNVIENTLRVIESEVGKEISYAALETKEFKYRLSVFDKFIRDILDYPHIKIMDKIGV